MNKLQTCCEQVSIKLQTSPEKVKLISSWGELGLTVSGWVGSATAYMTGVLRLSQPSLAGVCVGAELGNMELMK